LRRHSKGRPHTTQIFGSCPFFERAILATTSGYERLKGGNDRFGRASTKIKAIRMTPNADNAEAVEASQMRL
jgi:hypothetical protein